MRTIIGIALGLGLVVGFAGLVNSGVHAATGTGTDQEIVRALNEQNRQLARIAASLERISGQQPGWKLPN